MDTKSRQLQSAFRRVEECGNLGNDRVQRVRKSYYEAMDNLQKLRAALDEVRLDFREIDETVFPYELNDELLMVDSAIKSMDPSRLGVIL